MGTADQKEIDLLRQRRKDRNKMDGLLSELADIRRSINGVFSVATDELPAKEKLRMLEYLENYERFIVMRLSEMKGIMDNSSN